MRLISIPMLFLLVMTQTVKSHEPLFGIGPHVLFKGGFAPHLTFEAGVGGMETEFSLGYGVTRTWTLIAETPMTIDGNEVYWEGAALKSKLLLASRFSPGASLQLSGVGQFKY